MEDISRRDAMSRMARISGAVALGLTSNVLADGNELADTGEQDSSSQPMARAFRGQHQPQPLPFEPARLKGISEKLIRSHWENNYGGAVKALNAVVQSPWL